MMEQLENTIRELWKINAKPVLISLTLKAHRELIGDCNFQMDSVDTLKDVQTYLGIPVYKTIDTTQSNIMAVKDGFLSAFRLNCEELNGVEKIMCGGCSCTDEPTDKEILTDVSKMLYPKVKDIKVEQFGIYPILLTYQEVVALQHWLNCIDKSKKEKSA